MYILKPMLADENIKMTKNANKTFCLTSVIQFYGGLQVQTGP